MLGYANFKSEVGRVQVISTVASRSFILHIPTNGVLRVFAVLLAILLSCAGAENASAQGQWVLTSTPAGLYSGAPLLTLRDGTALLIGGSLVERYVPTSATWVRTGSLQVARSSFTATVLLDGRVLVVGGYDSTGKALASAEVYDPASGMWSVTGAMQFPRLGHTATLLPSGQVLVSGGTSTPSEVYDPATGTWSVSGVLNAARRNHIAVGLPSGKVLVAGGYGLINTNLASAEIYDPATGQWIFTGSMNIPRRSSAGVLLASGTVLVIGGGVPGPGGPNTSEIFDPASGTWALSLQYAELGGHGGDSAVRLLDNTVLILETQPGGLSGYGSDIAFIYDLSGGSWNVSNASVGGTVLGVGTSLTVLSDGRALLAGGREPGRCIPCGPAPARLFLPASASAALLTIAPATLDFGGTEPNQPVDRVVTLSNAGQTLLTGSGTLTGPFSFLSPTTFSLAAGESTSVGIRFTPSTFGTSSGVASFNSNGGLATVALRGIAGLRLSGRITVNGAPAGGVTVTEGGAATGTTKTDINGQYSFIVQPMNGYTLTPQLAGYAVTPASRSVVVNTINVASLDFTLTLQDSLAAFSGSLYDFILKRDPDQPGLVGWTNYLRSSCNAASLAQTVEAFFDSMEFRTLKPLTLTDLVTAIYRAMLGRDPDTPELQGFVGHFRWTRTSVAGEFAHSNEFLNDLPDFGSGALVGQLVTRLYQQFLGRTPASSERNAWVDYLQSTHDTDTTINAFITSQEFEAKALTFRDFIGKLYTTLLGRSSDSAALDGWESVFRQDLLNIIAQSFAPSEEFQSRATWLCQ